MDGSLVQEINFFPPQRGKKYKRADQGIVTSWLPLPDRWKQRLKSLNLEKEKKKDPNKGTRLWREAGMQQATQSVGMAECIVACRTWAKCTSAGDGWRQGLMLALWGFCFPWESQRET